MPQIYHPFYDWQQPVPLLLPYYDLSPPGTIVYPSYCPFLLPALLHQAFLIEVYPPPSIYQLMGSIGSGITVYFIPRTVLVFVWLVYGGRLQCLLSKPLEEVQIEMTNDSSFLSNASFRSGANKMGKK
jgi:hypothetical protein